MTPPRRRWFAFSLRTLFVGVAVLAVPPGWGRLLAKLDQ